MRARPMRAGPLAARVPALTLALVALVIALPGCGHPATRAECDELFAKTAEIELRTQKVTDPKVIAERTAAAKNAEGEAFAKTCLGKRITERALACVRRATSAEQIDRCL